MSKKQDIHVTRRNTRNGKKWAVVKEGSGRASSINDTQKEALDKARKTAKREKVEVVIHDRKNQIRDSDSYGNDPNPPKDKKH